MIDAHVHFWHYDPAEYAWIDDTMSALKRDYLPPDAKREMDSVGVTACVAVQARQTLDETRWFLDLAARHPFIMGVVGWIDLRTGDVERQLSEFTGCPALVGVRHIVQAEPDGFLASPDFRAGVARLERTGLVYEILVYARQMPDAVAFARALPRQRFVLDHVGKPDIRSGGFDRWRRHFDELAALPNVVCKLSGLVTEADWRSWTPGQLRPYLDAALESFGPSRLMIGTDWPVCTVAASYETVVGLVLEAIAEYSEAERLRILEGTARSVYAKSVYEAHA
jgi:L-fuconolactonase